MAVKLKAIIVLMDGFREQRNKKFKKNEMKGGERR